MPNCAVCGAETPVTRFYLVRLYEHYRGWWLYFCSKGHLKMWVEDGGIDAYQLGEPDPALREK